MPIENKEIESRGDDFVPTTTDETIVDTSVADAAEKAAAEKKPVTIPKERFDEAVGKERKEREAAENRAKELQAQLDANKIAIDTEKLDTEIDELEEALDKAAVDNDAAEKKRIRKEIRVRQEAIAEAKAEQRSRYATAVAVEQIRYDGLLERLETQHPEINVDSDKYDEAISADVLDLKQAYEAKGLSSSEALRKAASFVFKAVAEAKPPAEEKKDDAPKKDADAEAKRKEEAIKKGLETRGKQPPGAKAGGVDSTSAGGAVDGKAVAKMSDKDFDKLTDEELKRLRGDSA